MDYGPAWRATVTNGDASRPQRHGADNAPARPQRREAEPEQSWAQSAIGARGDDAAELWPADTSPPPNDDKETAAIKAFALVADRWQLTDQPAASLLGIDVDAWQTLRARVSPSTEHSVLTRRAPSSGLTDTGDEHSAPRAKSAPRDMRRTLHRLAADIPPREIMLSEDQLARISTCFYMYISLKRICAEGTADRWITCENYSPVFEGRTPLEVVIEGGLPKIREARNYISSAM